MSGHSKTEASAAQTANRLDYPRDIPVVVAHQGDNTLIYSWRCARCAHWQAYMPWIGNPSMDAYTHAREHAYVDEKAKRVRDAVLSTAEVVEAWAAEHGCTLDLWQKAMLRSAVLYGDTYQVSLGRPR